MIYDTANRIAGYLRLRPDRVYLYAGTRQGALALGQAPRAKWLEKSSLPKAFQRLTPSEVEDCLCIYADDIRRIRGLQE